jgi:hypothetical protein
MVCASQCSGLEQPLLAARIYRDYGAGAVVGLLVFGHWALDLISYPSHFRASLGVRGSKLKDIPCHPISLFFSVTR